MNKVTKPPQNNREMGSKGRVVSSLLVELCECSPEQALARLEATPTGLTEQQVERRQEQYGLNEVSHEKPPTWYHQLFEAFLTPFNGVLFAVSIVSLFSDVIFAAPDDRSFRTVIVLSAMVLLSTLLRFWQEFRSNQAAEELKAMVSSTTAVLRAGMPRAQELPISALVPGDIVHLSAGDMVPADVRLLSAKDLFVSQAMLTGESLPLEKYPLLPSPRSLARSPLELETASFMGTNVVSGTATAVVVATGDTTYFGAMARDIVGARPLTSFDIGVNRVSWMLIRFLLVMTPLVFLINGITKGDWLESLLFAVSVAVGLTPEMLPMIVTANLAKGAVMMARRKSIVKRLNAIQNFGAMDILCTDKTGTLTQNRVILERHLDIHGNEDSQVLELAWLNSFHQTGLKNLLDVAVLEYADQLELVGKVQHYQKVDEIPFDFVRRRMSVIVRNGGKNLLVCKGAIEEVLGLCAFADENAAAPEGVVPFTDEMRRNVREITRDLNEDGLRALAVAYKELPPEDRAYTVADEKELVLAGYVAFLDPPKETAREAIAALNEHGVAVKIITGDNEVVTRKICKEVGLAVDLAMAGKDVAALADAELAEAAERTTIFTKMSPLEKSRVIRALQSKGHTVGYLGDGINDAAALKDADVGISVDTAVDIAKESADIILLEKSLLVLEEAVIEGRKTFANIIKYIKMTASSNFGNVFSVLVASVFLPFLPMLPIQLLIQNLLYDISQVSIPWDDVDRDYLTQPRKWDAGGVARFMVFIGPISSIFDIVTFIVMWHVFGADSVEKQSLFQSGWFVVGLLTQTLIVHMIRTQHIPFIQSRAATPVILLTVSIMAIGIYLPFSPLGAHVGMVPLPMSYFPWLIGILLSYCLLTQLIKRFYIRRFGQWL
ncbi:MULTISPECIES: magnesium-translocating P-type ATPase [Bradyrhizobium]|jgi:Mg2+-importing ATPase|uniref:Magnesium-transporting ATPase, P-type 1 n=2 Tax=Bradyrhizobium TaxID=374 RepID=A0ABS5GJM5_9BRAD|nr:MULTISPECIES: magnesium-translocating P-type ATPase [Bradyrhizobium]MBR1141537.1 magnesium-translocating P-type ATPase [Bradyrhizobium denitrificans]MDU1498056.1 magnesium-translocating P-type ATPase [Bradyrhizobium sp.]MDU1548318.1 magnesium-translocating P-type ATPase [Bradyrhizobium sp.]MDU1692331.1 magnesium-translocating P-type ATPase [Bradyrhizobium sp.]MDU1808454.1 magnesium-translocating P-type ATPase [Bradyrhizobium sp.]